MTKEEYEEAANFWKKKQIKIMPSDQLKSVVEEYLANNSVCALATGAGEWIRCTPLEYSYHDGKFWIFTEGGEKFIGLEKNNNVSLAVFDKNSGFGELKSVQVKGEARIIKPMSREYLSHAEYKKIPASSLQRLFDQGHPMHLLCITPIKMDVLMSSFKNAGYDARQTLVLR